MMSEDQISRTCWSFKPSLKTKRNVFFSVAPCPLQIILATAVSNLLHQQISRAKVGRGHETEVLLREGHSWEQTTVRGEGTRASCHGSWRRKTPDLLINSTSCSSIVRRFIADVLVRYPAVTWLTNSRNLLLTSLQTRKSKITASAGSVSSEDPLPGSQMAIFSLCPLMAGRGQGTCRGRGALTRPHPHDLITAQHPHTED